MRYIDWKHTERKGEGMEQKAVDRLENINLSLSEQLVSLDDFHDFLAKILIENEQYKTSQK